MKERRGLEVQQERRQDLDATVFRLSGRMIGTRECYEFLDEVRDEIHAGRRNIVLNLAGLERISSAGIGILAACYTSATRADGRICIAAVPDSVSMLLKIVCLWDVIQRYDSEEDALAALAPPPA